jgi:hypothetical protein
MIDIDDDNLTFEDHRVVITRVTGNERVNAQFLHTLGPDIFVYVFGDRVTDLTIQGMAFPFNCEDQTSQPGIVRVIEWYRRHRLARQQSPLLVSIGGQAGDQIDPLVAYLLGAQYDIADPKTRLAKFTLQMARVPDPQGDG